MALSMDEQRMLAEIERHFAAEEPGLASNLATLRKPGRVSVFRSTRARVIGSLFTVAVVAMVSLMVYAMLPFRSSGRTTGNHPVTTSSTNTGQSQAKISAPSGSGTRTGTARTSASASAKTSASARASTSSSARAGVPSASAAYADEHETSPG